MPVRRWSAALSLAVAAACSDSPPTAPAGAVIGRFGGAGAELVGTTREVQFTTACGTYRFPQALVPDANNGTFALGPIVVPVGSGVQAAIVLRGTVASGRLDLESRFLTPSSEGLGARFTLTRNQSPDFANLACAT
jgi:hypothetical protein